MHTTSLRAAARPAPSTPHLIGDGAAGTVRSTPHLIWRALAALLMSTLLLGTGSAAFAHDTLTDSSPAEGETLTEPPTQVELTFSAEVLEMGAAAVVTDADGTTWEDGEPVVDGTGVTVPLKEGMTNGSYEISWRVTSSDGHPISGVIPFTLDGAEETTEPETPTSAGPTAEEPTATDETTTDETTTEEATTEEGATEEGATTADDAVTSDVDSAAADADESDDDSGFPWVAVVVLLVVIVGVLLVYGLMRRRGSDQ